MISVAITASWRNKPTLDNTIRSLRRGGFKQKFFVFLEPDVQVENHENIEVYKNTERLGNCLHRLKALTYVYKNTDSQWIMMVEDDVECHSHASKHINQICFIKRNEPVGFISGYTPVAYAVSHPHIFEQQEGWINFNRKECTWGGQCLILPKTSAELFINHEHNFEIGQHDIDKQMGIFFDQRDLPCYYPVPSLFEHLGLNNSIYNAPDDRNVGLRYGEHFKLNNNLEMSIPKFI